MAPTPVALPPCLPSELLSYILMQTAYPTTLIICASRASFLSSLLKSISQRRPQAPASPTPRLHTPPVSSEDILEIDEDHQVPENLLQEEEVEHFTHPLLIPTLHQLATSRHITTVFIPTVSHLRAYLSIFSSTSIAPPTTTKPFDKPGSHIPRLVVYNMISLHRDTSEWSAQGMGGSFACLVEAGLRSSMGVLAVEGRDDGEFAELEEDEMLQKEDGETEDDNQEENENYGGAKDVEEDLLMQDGNENEARISRQEAVQKRCRRRAERLWREGMPMLNGSTRRAGMEAYDGPAGPTWGGRTVEVRTVLGRWFNFARDNYWEDARFT